MTAKTIALLSFLFLGFTAYSQPTEFWKEYYEFRLDSSYSIEEEHIEVRAFINYKRDYEFFYTEDSIAAYIGNNCLQEYRHNCGDRPSKKDRHYGLVYTSTDCIRKWESNCQYRSFCVEKEPHKLIIKLENQNNVGSLEGIEIIWTKGQDSMKLWIKSQYTEDFILKNFSFQKGTYFISDLQSENNSIKKEPLTIEPYIHKAELHAKWLIEIKDWQKLKTSKCLEKLF